jgi:CRP-like cAMP-binding protein
MGYDISEGLTDAERQQLEDQLSESSHEADRVLLREGEPTPGLLLILEGSVSVGKKDMGGQEQLLTDLSAPVVVGDLELLTGEPCTATVTTTTCVRTKVLPTETFERMLEQGEKVAIKLMRNLARALGKKLEATNEMYVDLAIWK